VRELLVAGTRRVIEVLVDPERVDDEIVELAREAHVPVRRIGRDALAALARSEVPQGVVARAEPLAEVSLPALARTGRPLLLVCDGVTDPHNLGALMRSAVAAGATGAVLPRHRAVGVTPTVAKAAAGAIEHLPIARVAGIPAALRELRTLGVWSVGLDEDGDVELDDVAVLTEPVALVLGAEGRGLSPLVAQRCEVLARIPMSGALESLNVSAAGAVAFFTAARLRRAPTRP
jgi:23S rRNA (guanosine2251-2'-O)-methyltransferase